MARKLFKKDINKNKVRNIKYDDITIKTKKRRFSKIEVDQYADYDLKKDKIPLIIKLREYFYGVGKEYFIIQWQKRKQLLQDYKIIISFIITMMMFFLITDLIFILLRNKGLI